MAESPSLFLLMTIISHAPSMNSPNTLAGDEMGFLKLTLRAQLHLPVSALLEEYLANPLLSKGDEITINFLNYFFCVY